MTNLYKLICTDIDGTLLDHRRELSDLTIETFRSLPEEVHIVLASSRMPSAMTHLLHQMGRTKGHMICYNGGYIIHYNGPDERHEAIHSTFIPADVCEGIAALTSGTGIHVSLYFEDQWFAPEWDYWSEREARITKVQPVITDINEVIETWKEKKLGGHKVMCMGDEQEIEKMEVQLNEKFGEQIHVYRSRPTYLELAPKAMSKGSGLELLLKDRIGMAIDEVIAFGDNYNDIELLKTAGKGVAVANARPEVLEVADEVTGISKEDGVAHTIKKYFVR